MRTLYEPLAKQVVRLRRERELSALVSHLAGRAERTCDGDRIVWSVRDAYAVKQLIERAREREL